MHLSPILVEETRRSLLNARLRNAYGHEEAAVQKWCSDLVRLGTMFPRNLPDIGSVCRDPDDDHVIALAVAVAAGAIVTGDRDLLALGEFQGVRMLTARAFLTES
jgi:putative PIN family toxin of toxin-antitoxin system